VRVLFLLPAFIVLLCAVRLETRHAEAGLLRIDPDATPARSNLMGFAIRRGKPWFEARCAFCHGMDAKGDSRKGIPDLTDADWLYGTGTVLDIEQSITYGIRSHNPRGWNLAVMPAYGKPRPSPTDDKIAPLSPSDIDDLIELQFHQQSRPADPAAVNRGTALYYGRGGCYDCHSADIKGDSAIGAPNLSDRITLYGDGSRESLFQSIAYGRQGACPAWVGALSPATIREIALYIFSLSHPKPPAHVE